MVYGELIHQGWRLAANEFVVYAMGIVPSVLRVHPLADRVENRAVR